MNDSNIPLSLLMKKPTPKSKLRKLELEVTQARFRTIQELGYWMIRKGFKHYSILNNWLGSPEDCSFQMYKPFGKKSGKKRWHWRVYDYPNEIRITSELEEDPIGNKNDPMESIGRHLVKDVLNPRINKNYGLNLPTHKKNLIVLIK